MTSIPTGPATSGMQWLAIPVATSIIIFLGYSSQWLFYSASYLQPGPLSTTESAIFNGLLFCLWWTYFKACTVDPGRYVFDASAVFDVSDDPMSHALLSAYSSSASSASSTSPSHTPAVLPRRWCKKCRAPKPPRAHHCRHCARCVPKMDHHCPWTGNCVSMQTFPHFLRFVVFTNVSLWMLCFLLARRFYALWEERHLPSYLGPSLTELAHLAVLALVGSATTLTLAIMLYTTMSAWLFNTTMIECWEIDRHEAVVDRHNSTQSDGTYRDEDDDYDYGDDGDDDDDDDADDAEGDEDSSRRRTGTVAPQSRVEFPYDIGLFGNMSQSMGTRNVLMWFFPFAGGPAVALGGSGTGWDWPENGFNSKPGMWPPPDPDKIRQAEREAWGRSADGAVATASGHDHSLSPNSSWKTGSAEEEKAAFQLRQAADFRRRQHGVGAKEEVEEGMDGRPGWTNADGDRLRDYGVDEEVDGDEEDVPLAELIRRRKKGQ